jgi:hypothetical protein
MMWRRGEEVRGLEEGGGGGSTVRQGRDKERGK